MTARRIPQRITHARCGRPYRHDPHDIWVPNGSQRTVCDGGSDLQDEYDAQDFADLMADAEPEDFSC